MLHLILAAELSLSGCHAPDADSRTGEEARAPDSGHTGGDSRTGRDTGRADSTPDTGAGRDTGRAGRDTGRTDTGTAPVEPVVIIGAGIAGLAAAMDLAPCTILEAGTAAGGRYLWAGGQMFFTGTEEEQAAGETETAAEVLSGWSVRTGGAGTGATADFLQASDGVHDRLTGLGLQFQYLGDHLHTAAGGAEVVARLLAALPADAELRLETPALDLEITGGRVTGVVTADGTIPANTVIIATGGFVGRFDLLHGIYGLPEGVMYRDTHGAGGFHIDMAQQHGLQAAALDAVGHYRRIIGSTALPVPTPVGTLSDPRWVAIDATGRRFADETAGGTLGLHGAISQRSDVWAISTQELLSGVLSADQLAALAASPSYFQCFSSREAVAAGLGVDAAGLAATWEEVAALRLGGDPDPFGRQPGTLPDLAGTPCAFQIGYEASKNFGGLLVDSEGAVPGVGGLYAVGEAAGMGQPGMGGLWGFDGSSAAILWSGWRTAAAIQNRR